MHEGAGRGDVGGEIFEAMIGRFFRLSPTSARSALMLASTKLMPAIPPAPWVVT